MRLKLLNDSKFALTELFMLMRYMYLHSAHDKSIENLNVSQPVKRDTNFLHISPSIYIQISHLSHLIDEIQLSLDDSLDSGPEASADACHLCARHGR